MSHSFYIKLATLLVRADLRREEREWKRKIRRSRYDLPWHNVHLLKDIGLQPDGRLIGVSVPIEAKAERHVRHIRRVLSLRIPT